MWTVELQSVDKVMSSISQLYSHLNVEHYQLQRERELENQLTELQRQIEPFEQVLQSLSSLSRGVRNVINCRPGTRISFERVPGYPLKIHNSMITVIESCWSGHHLANN